MSDSPLPRVAIVGATNPGAMLWDRDNLAGRLEIRDIVPEVAREVRAVRDRFPALTLVDVELTFDPPWTPDRMSDAARAKFGW